ncbi:Hsp20/alpha crystallin family protein [Clostridium sp. C2-6-12]|uniref:Hsp20/alpha crystallin family protein n=1 Tax=Clostridium sp. C2-6-12 TaxID=2698832 RepID=UPI00136EE8C8|nr:Hsp20/alpha crystallin family protein [Clostridium sp. C2-6-12]
MFKIFSFGFNDIFNENNIEKMSGIMHSILDNMDISQFTEEYEDEFSGKPYEQLEKSNTNDFIELKEDKDMYFLSIDLKGVNIREVSIRYDPGIIQINLYRLEIQKSFIGIMPRNVLVKRLYRKKFENIEDIDTNQVYKNIDDGILSIRMQKKYPLECFNTIVDVDSYEDDIDN